MSHVDDGELTAYADGAYPANDPDALRISAHLSACDNCRTRLEQAHGLRDQAAQILGQAAPAVRTPPAFEALEARVATSPSERRRPLNLAWAASIILALGLGWFGRGTLQDPPASRSAATEATAPVAAGEPEPMPATTQAARAATATPGEPDAPVSNRPDEPSADPQPLADRAPQVGAVAAAPPPAAPAEADIAGAAAQDARVLNAAEAERRGVVVPRIPELPVATIALGDTTVVEQTLPDGKVIRLAITADAETRAATENLRREESAPAPARARVAAPEMAKLQAVQAAPVTLRYQGRLITVTGDLPADSLRALARKIR